MSETNEEIANLKINIASSSLTEEETSHSGNEKTMNLMSAVLSLCGAIIGTGIFMTPNNVVNLIPSLLYSLLIWFGCGVFSLLAGLCYCELAGALKNNSGEYIYFEKAYHESFAFSFCFTNILFIKPVSIAILVLFFVETMINLFYPNMESVPLWSRRLMSAVVTILMCVLNCSSNKWSTRVNDFLTYFKFICMGIIISLSIYKMARGEFENVKDWGLKIPFSIASLSGAFYNGMWAYDGFNQLSYKINDIKKPEINLLRASIIGFTLIIAFYVMINFSYFILLGVAGLSSSSNVAKSAVLFYMKKFTVIIVLLVALSAFATANVTAYSAVEIYADAAKKGHLPKLIGYYHKTQRTMIPALILQALLTIFYLISFPDIKLLLNYFSGASWVFYSLAFIAVVVLKFKKGSATAGQKTKHFKVYTFVPIFVALVSVCVVILGFIDDWAAGLTSISLIIVSVPFYFVFVRGRKENPIKYCNCIDNITEKIALALNLEFDSPSAETEKLKLIEKGTSVANSDE